MRKTTIETALEVYGYGFAVTYDGDSNMVMYGIDCKCCGEYFEDKGKEFYCRKCS